MMRSLLCCTAIVLAVLPRPAAALTIDVGATRDGPIIVVAGEFLSSDDFSGFERLVRENRARWVTFDSPGGEIYRAMELGRLIRRLDLETMAWRSFECSSACAFAFLGGIRRYAEPGSIGIHRSWLGDDDALSVEQAVEEVQQVTSDMMGYISDMGVDPALMRLALQYGNRDMRYLSVSETEQFRVTTFGWAVEPAAGGDPTRHPWPFPQAAASQPDR